ncbi:GNAT family N-acetyltransferase [Actinacidiphila sp. bgisy145]|uniref:GNAT family N-acetyltransferase n=1 Tax=Actinacidiphila sp. bgisy145 TaxID=3413792 RepID=UPI003EBA1F09
MDSTNTAASTGTRTAAAGGWSLRPSTPADVETVADLRALVMRPDLERLGRYDEHRVRQRLRDGFSREHTSIVLADGALAGSVTFRPEPDGSRVLEHFYLARAHQGRGLGTWVLGTLLARADRAGETTRLIVLQGSAARRLYERHGFTVESEDPIDVFMVRPPAPAAS